MSRENPNSNNIPTQLRNLSHFIRQYSQLTPIANSVGPLNTGTSYDHLLRLCLELCGKVNARQLFDEMPQRVSLAFWAGKAIHGRGLRLGFGLSGLLGNAVLDLYAKCGHARYANRVFGGVEGGGGGVEGWNSIMTMNLRRGLLENVVESFGLMRVSGVWPNEFSYATLLSCCAKLVDVCLGRQVHCDVVKMGYLSSFFCEGSLVDMYVKCNAVGDARKLFERVSNPSLVSWTAMIVGYVNVGCLDEALRMFESMRKLGCAPDHVAFVTMISALVNDGRLDEAGNLFVQMPFANTIAWNLMISGHAKRGYGEEAVSFFLNMRKAGVSCTRSTLGSVLKAVASLKNFCIGLSIHAQAIKQGLDGNVYVGSSLIKMYANCQKPDLARCVFDFLGERNVVLWNSMLGGYAQNDSPNEVVDLFFDLKSSGSRTDEFTYTSILSACGGLRRLDLGSQLHAEIIKNHYESNLFVGNALVDMYAKSGALAEARQLFDNMKDRDNISWNVIIVGCVQEEKENEAFCLFQRMMSDSTLPDEVALASILSACANIKDLSRGRQLHCMSVKQGLDTRLYAGSSLIDMYVKCGATAAAGDVFYHLPKWNVVSANALIFGYAQDNLEEAVKLYKIMPIEGLYPSEITFAHLLDACCEPSTYRLGLQIHGIVFKKGLLDDGFLGISLLGMYMNSLKKKEAIKLFLEFPDRKSTISWTSIISGLNHNGCYEEALQLFKEMRGNVVMPDQATFASVLKACSTLTFLRDGTKIHGFVLRTGFSSDVLVGSALIDMYAKCGDVKSSIQVFKEIDLTWDVVAWNSMIVGLAKNGLGEEALKIFDEMLQSHLDPDDVTFLGVLSACSHAGKISEGRAIYDLMVTKYEIQPRNEHCACMIDLFGRWGFLEEAESFIEKLQFRPDAMIWASYLGACKLHGDDLRGKYAAEKLINLDPHDSSAYVLLSSIHASSGNWKEVDSLRRQMREKGVEKLPGSSWIGRIDNKVPILRCE